MFVFGEAATNKVPKMVGPTNTNIKVLKALCLPPMKPPSFICCYSIDSIDAAASFHFAQTATAEKKAAGGKQQQYNDDTWDVPS